jgi:hypothetical protein
VAISFASVGEAIAPLKRIKPAAETRFNTFAFMGLPPVGRFSSALISGGVKND